MNYTDWAWRQTTRSGTAKLVLLALARHADSAGHAVVSVKTLHADTGIYPSNIYTAVQVLEHFRLVKVTRVRWRVNTYTLQVEHNT